MVYYQVYSSPYRVKEISFKRRASYMKLDCVKGNLVIIRTLKTPITFPLSQLLNTNYIKQIYYVH